MRTKPISRFDERISWLGRGGVELPTSLKRQISLSTRADPFDGPLGKTSFIFGHTSLLVIRGVIEVVVVAALFVLLRRRTGSALTR
jgi:hypothetical protein